MKIKIPMQALTCKLLVRIRKKLAYNFLLKGFFKGFFLFFKIKYVHIFNLICPGKLRKVVGEFLVFRNKNLVELFSCPQIFVTLPTKGERVVLRYILETT